MLKDITMFPQELIIEAERALNQFEDTCFHKTPDDIFICILVREIIIPSLRKLNNKAPYCHVYPDDILDTNSISPREYNRLKTEVNILLSMEKGTYNIRI